MSVNMSVTTKFIESTEKLTLDTKNNMCKFDIEVSINKDSVSALNDVNNIRKGKTILGVKGEGVDGSNVNDSYTIKLSDIISSDKTFSSTDSSKYKKVIIPKIDNSIDSNITADNIVSGVTILGVTGNFSANSESVNRKEYSEGTYASIYASSTASLFPFTMSPEFPNNCFSKFTLSTPNIHDLTIGNHKLSLTLIYTQQLCITNEDNTSTKHKIFGAFYGFTASGATIYAFPYCLTTDADIKNFIRDVAGREKHDVLFYCNQSVGSFISGYFYKYIYSTAITQNNLIPYHR